MIPALPALVVSGAIALAGCTALGPQVILRDRSDYSDALAESWMRQYLLNIVKLRYLSPPVFVDVGSIVSSYTIETDVGVELGLVRRGDDSLSLLGGRRFADRPTTTYSAVAGDQFVSRYMTPLLPESLFSLVEMGLPADIILLTGISAWNTLRNRQFSVDGGIEGDDAFFRSVELFRRIQDANGVDLRVAPEEGKAPATLLILQSEYVSAAVQSDIGEFQRLLGLNPDASEYRLVFGTIAQNDREIAVHTRSTLQVMSMLAAGIAVPREHIDEGRAPPDLRERSMRLMDVKTGRSAPEDALVAIRYRDHWFWIDDRDLASKRVFSLLMRIFSFADTTAPVNLPLLIQSQ